MLDCRILTSENEIEALADQWRELHARIGGSPFANYDVFSIWWGTVGKTAARHKLHVVAGYENGKLAAVLPLTVIGRKGLRIMQAAGYQGYNYCDMLAENADQAVQLWQVARQSPHYDFADIRDVYPESVCYEALNRFACRRDLTNAYAVRVNWSTGEDWLASKSNHTRNNFKRCIRRLQEKGTLSFEVCRAKPLPPNIIDDMVKRKIGWSFAHGKQGLFQKPGVLDYYRQLSEMAAEQGFLFLAWLRCGDHVIAYNQGFLDRGVIHNILLTHDPEWNQYSPGKAMQVYTVFWGIEHGVRSLDFRQGESQFKKIYANEKRQCAEFTFNGSSRGRLIENAYMGARTLLRRMRGDPGHAVGED
jgi:CelD/BcsL family acetyltransferase involved in cellulose biosynthesis